MYYCPSMIIKKLRSTLEDEQPSFTTGYAILVHKTNLSKTLEEVKNHKIPTFLKRVKCLFKDWFYVLTNFVHADFETIKIKIPHKQAYTEEQYLKYKEVWPCIFYKKKEKEISHEYVKKWIQKFTSETKGLCLIVKEDVLLSFTYNTDNVLGNGIFKGVDYVSRKRYGYLCTGFDAFILDEPCLSCAMALLHGRIARVFCLNRSEGVFSKDRFNFNKNINHRYDVYFIDNWK
ncbi:hypothetical protein NCER_102439 [Vairimorpha ceranae BRL01]|uniref:CMP/dCMP-type deaminase domain-containing protein n=1 Tax=Vairimorpha ceranae (strain BRL01) TaxID=578460 RepID=C4VC09_VAIC1|nr:hypothetical protein NCER_102439 [Vairimorpha ceranae BRL01]